MPELAEVETWRRLAHREAEGEQIVEALAVEDDKVFDRRPASEVAEQLQGKRFVSSGRRGKHFWMRMEPESCLYLHFGMSCSLMSLAPQEEAPSHWKLLLLFSNGKRLCFRNPRRIGRLRWYPESEPEEVLAKLGPDPLEQGLELQVLTPLLQTRKAPIKALLLNQKLFAGVGNWIADEVLYQSRISPHRKGTELSEADCRLILKTLKRILNTAVDVEADDSLFPKSWLFPYRWGKQAERGPKGEVLQFDTVGGRTSCWAPERQH